MDNGDYHSEQFITESSRIYRHYRLTVLGFVHRNIISIQEFNLITQVFAMANQFRLLLNKISCQLNEQDLRSLVHMCDIPEGLRSGMKDGISLFDNLIKRDIINEHNLDRLKMMLKNLSPKRRDLIKQIENFENGTYLQDDRSSTLTSIVSITSTQKSVATSDTAKPTEICCTLECPCLMIVLKKFRFKIASSYIVLTALFSLSFLLVALFWYAGVPKITESIESHKHLKKSGPFILIGIIVMYVICLFSMRYARKRRTRQSNQSAAATGIEDGMKEFRTKRSGKNQLNSAGLTKVENNRTTSTNYGFSRYIHDENTCIVESDTNQDHDALPRTN